MSQLAIYSECSFTAKDFYLIYSNKNQVADLWREKKTKKRIDFFHQDGENKVKDIFTHPVFAFQFADQRDF